MHIYDVKNIKDNNIESELKIGCSPSREQAILMINDYPHAIFDFKNKNGCCRSNFPAPNGSWSKSGHEWNDELLKYFK